MSTLKNPTELSGLLGESLSVRKLGKRVVVKNRPQRKYGPLSDKQEAFAKRFLEAAHYARYQMGLEESRSLYTKGITTSKRTAYLVAVTDALVAPEVESVNADDYHGVIGDIIAIKAFDDFMVTRVKVSITDASGGIIEVGEAVADPSKMSAWDYKATVANPALAGCKIRAVAYDKPGNVGMAEIVI